MCGSPRPHGGSRQDVLLPPLFIYSVGQGPSDRLFDITAAVAINTIASDGLGRENF